MKRFLISIFCLIFFSTSIFAGEEEKIYSYDAYYDNPIMLTKKEADTYEEYAKEIVNFLTQKFKDTPMPKKIMKFGQWDADVSCHINKDGTIEKFFLQSNTESKVYTLIDKQYVMTKDINKTYNRKDMSQVYFTYDFFYHPIRKKVSLKYQQEFSDHVKNFLIQNSQLPPFPQDIKHKQLIYRITFRYIPLDTLKYYGYSSVKTTRFSGIGTYARDGIYVPPSWQLFINKK